MQKNAFPSGRADGPQTKGMSNRKNNEIRIGTTAEDFREGRRFIVDMLRKKRVAKTVISELLLVFEALFHEISEQGYGGNQELELSVYTRFTETVVGIRFAGRMFLFEREGDEISPDRRMLKAYADRLDYNYHSGVNRITIIARRSRANVILFSLMAVLLAAAAYALTARIENVQSIKLLHESVIVPLERVFANSMLMVGAPVTFLSLLNNMTDAYVVSSVSSDARRLQKRTFLTSASAVVLATVSAFIINMNVTSENGYLSDYPIKSISARIAELIESLVSPDIFTPFETVSPFPIIVLAGLMTYAFCASGKYFRSLKNAVKAAYVLFSKMLSVVMYTLPLFFVLALFDLFLTYGYKTLLVIPVYGLLAVAGLPLLLIMYYLRLKLGHVKIRSFMSGLGGFLKENISINSAIDAVPFNVRYCTRVYGMDRKRLEEALPVLAQINLDGNCYIITMVSVLVLLQNGHGANWFEVAMIGLLVFMLSLGAPNQPGSCLIGFVIILNYLNAFNLLPFAIIGEVVFGGLLNLINVTGDLVTVSVDDVGKPDPEAHAHEHAHAG